MTWFLMWLLAINTLLVLLRRKMRRKYWICDCEFLSVPSLCMWPNDYMCISASAQHLEHTTDFSLDLKQHRSWRSRSYFMKSISGRTAALSSHPIAVVTPLHPPPPPDDCIPWQQAWRKQQQAASSSKGKASSPPPICLFLYSCIQNCKTHWYSRHVSRWQSSNRKECHPVSRLT